MLFRSDRALSLAIIDMDHFKLINDTFGHDKGDIMLKQLAYELDGQIRHSDMLYRLGGDEFVIIFIETNLEQARIVCEKINHVHNLLALKIDDKRSTLSIGLTTLQNNDDSNNMFNRADDALYHAKKHGRNRLSVYEDITATQQTVNAR